MVRVARRDSDGSPRRRWLWTVAAVALASVSAAAGRARARRRADAAGETGETEGVPDRPGARATAGQKAAAVAATATAPGATTTDSPRSGEPGSA